MNRKNLLLVFLALTGCSITPETDKGNILDDIPVMSAEKQTESTFILTAAPGYVKFDDYDTPHTYLVDIDRNEVYVDMYEEPTGLTPEEIIENAEKSEEIEEYVHPIFEIESLDTTADSFVLQYNSKSVEFTALSDSYYEDQDGIRYVIDSYSGIEDYIENYFKE